MKVIDGLTFIGESIYWRGRFKVEDLLEKIDANNVSLAVVTAPPKPPYYESANKRVYEAVKKYSDKLIGFYRVNPWFKVSELNRVERAIKNWGFKGIVLDPQHDSYPVNSPIIKPFIELAEKHNIPVYLKSSNSQFNPPDAVLLIASKHPNVTFITENSQTSLRILLDENIGKNFENVVLTTYPLRGGPEGRDRSLTIIAEKIPSRLVFASHTPLGSLELELKILEKTELSNEIKTKILEYNLKRILGL